MKTRPTDAKFDELKRNRDEAIARVAAGAAKMFDCKPGEILIHVSGAGNCYCACPDGPCQHIWDGPEEAGENYSSVTCSRCGLSAMAHDVRCAP